MDYFSNLPTELHLLISSFLSIKNFSKLEISSYLNQILDDNELWYYIILNRFPFFIKIAKSKTIQSYEFNSMKDICMFLIKITDIYINWNLSKFEIKYEHEICKFIQLIIKNNEFYILESFYMLHRRFIIHNTIDEFNPFVNISLKIILQNNNILGIEYIIYMHIWKEKDKKI